MKDLIERPSVASDATAPQSYTASGGTAQSPQAFRYDEAFSRNLGWVTEDEQRRLRTARVAIAGLGGVGGGYLLTLARLGVSRFSVADFDEFGLVNFNRQAGATMSSLGQPKADVLLRMVRDINPEADVRVLRGGVDTSNVDRFLEGVDVYVDGLDFFAFDAREAVFKACERLRIPATTVAPLGMGAALLNFVPGGMTFEQYFRWEGCDETEKALRFLVGLSPSFLHAGYLVAPERVDMGARRGPSTIMACQLCAGIAATEVLKVVLGRGDVLAAPWGLHFDAYRGRMKRTWRPGGNRNPIQALALRIARRRYARIATAGSGR
jgi:molybdopterin/thiamine biosynthesis adenylyltransferase